MRFKGAGTVSQIGQNIFLGEIKEFCEVYIETYNEITTGQKYTVEELMTEIDNHSIYVLLEQMLFIHSYIGVVSPISRVEAYLEVYVRLTGGYPGQCLP